MAKYLPLFPLQVVVFPGEKLNLHIFEPRYIQLVLDCLETGITFGIPAYIKNGVGIFGTEVELVQVEKKYDSGEMDIRTKALSVFRIRQFDKVTPGKLYAGGQVEAVADVMDENIVIKNKIREAVQELYSILGIGNLFLKLPENFRSFDIAHTIGLSLEQEYMLLQLTTESERQLLILEHIERILPVVVETERLKERVKLNGHFKNLTPPNF
ncbi:LON peptidase substrate-binding domain-containing protein [Pontibacter arcticus]|uniref:Peptidase n=1 Tax=Pontibacter arcticus TaxID=2080288 RepID=A0A364RCI1_9BACT|nr:LON peptidase substrate-binding domain-containing protein [Pontibacter arcticus]RAU82002.1 peptidase [Pontibacter arcticus]